MPEEQKSAQDLAAEEGKKHKGVIDAHGKIAEYELGRSPTPAELGERLLSTTDTLKASAPAGGTDELEKDVAIEGDDEGENSSVPEPNLTKVTIRHHPEDSNNILFFEDTDGLCCDTETGNWYDQLPEGADQLPQRPINFTDSDIVASIMHGVMDDEDFNFLDQAGMIEDHHRELHGKHDELAGQLIDAGVMPTEDLEKSSPISFELPVDEVESPRESTVMDTPEADEPATEEAFQDTIRGIMDLALDKATAADEDRIREIVREEIEKILS